MFESSSKLSELEDQMITQPYSLKCVKTYHTRVEFADIILAVIAEIFFFKVTL